MAISYDTQPIVVGNTMDFQLAAGQGGIAWDLTEATVSLEFRRPDGTIVGPSSATITDGPGGLAHFQCLDTLLDIDGRWARQWKVTQSGVELASKQIVFLVAPSLFI